MLFGYLRAIDADTSTTWIKTFEFSILACLYSSSLLKAHRSFLDNQVALRTYYGHWYA